MNCAALRDHREKQPCCLIPKDQLKRRKKRDSKDGSFASERPGSKASTAMETQPLSFCVPNAQIAPYVQKLAKSFKVVVTVFDGVPCHVTIEIAEEAGLYKLEHGREEPVKEIVLKSCYCQSSQFTKYTLLSAFML